MQTHPDPLTTTFAALADPTRRAILARLATGEATVTELAAPFDVSLPAISKHLKVLQRAGLVEQGRQAQWRPCRLRPEPLHGVADWVGQYRRLWEDSLDRLDDYLREIQRTDEPGDATTRRHDDTTTSQGAGAMTVQQQLGNDRTTVYVDGLEVVFERVFDAPRDLVWNVMTDPERIPRWWGPHGYTTIVVEMDVRARGTLALRGPHDRRRGRRVQGRVPRGRARPSGSSGRSPSTSPGSTTSRAPRS